MLNHPNSVCVSEVLYSQNSHSEGSFTLHVRFLKKKKFPVRVNTRKTMNIKQRTRQSHRHKGVGRLYNSKLKTCLLLFMCMCVLCEYMPNVCRCPRSVEGIGSPWNWSCRIL